MVNSSYESCLKMKVMMSASLFLVAVESVDFFFREAIKGPILFFTKYKVTCQIGDFKCFKVFLSNIKLNVDLIQAVSAYLHPLFDYTGTT